MRWSTLFLGILLLFGLYVEWPYLWFWVNEAADLPVLDFGLLKYVGLLLVSSSFLFLFYLTFLFKKKGKGTPIPVERSQWLIVDGPYRYTRNPMYLTHVVVWLGLFLFFGEVTLLFGLVVGWLGFHLLVVYWEEPRLQTQLGKDYFEYKKSVPRWF